MPSEITLLFEDAHLAIVDKPSGMLVHRGWDNDPVVAMTLLRDQLGRHVFPVHRLDRGTSGALLFALSSEVAAALQKQFEEGAVQKRYLALVRGIPKEEQGVVDHPVPKTEDGPRVAAVTAWRRLWAGERFSLVEAEPKTGRFHQIRRHLKHLGHPLVGDVNYGRGEINRMFREQYGLSRLALHARALTLRHPQTGEQISVQAPVPEDLAKTFSALGIPEGLWR
ncbi:MAG TPA: pseudouridine synthase [Myxococcales bacterium]